MFKLTFWVALIGGIVLVAGQVIPAHYNNMKVENVFEGVAKSMANSSEADIRKRMNELLKSQSVDLKALPKSFFDNLYIEKEDGKLYVGTEYHLVLWILGKPTSVDPDEEYSESDVKGMDKIRMKARMDFDFAPQKESK